MPDLGETFGYLKVYDVGFPMELDEFAPEKVRRPAVQRLLRNLLVCHARALVLQDILDNLDLMILSRTLLTFESSEIIEGRGFFEPFFQGHVAHGLLSTCSEGFLSLRRVERDA